MEEEKGMDSCVILVTSREIIAAVLPDHGGFAF